MNGTVRARNTWPRAQGASNSGPPAEAGALEMHHRAVVPIAASPNIFIRCMARAPYGAQRAPADANQGRPETQRYRCVSLRRNNFLWIRTPGAVSRWTP